MPLGTTPLQSPGCNEGKTRNETLGTHRQKQIELRRSGTSNARIGIYPLGSAAPLGLNKCKSMINPGLAPWAMQEYRPYRALLRLSNHFIILMRLPCLPKVSASYSSQWVRRTRCCKCAHLLKWVPRTYFGEYVVLILMFPKAIGDRATQITTSIPFLYSRVLFLCCSYIYIIHSKHS